MTFWKMVRVPVLTVLIGLLAYIAYARGLVWMPGARAATLATPYETEEAWIVTTVARNLAGFCLASQQTPARAPQGLAVTVAPRPGDGHDFDIRVVPGRTGAALTATISLPEGPWSPEAYAPFAQQLRTTWCAGQAAEPDRDDAEMLAALLHVRPRVIERQNHEISSRLSAHMLDADAHSEAALLLGVFAMREAAGLFSDVRDTLSRATAHLVFARMLAGSSSTSSPSGRYAHVILLTLSGRGADALAALQLLEAHSQKPFGDWNRALRLRITQDVRDSRPAERSTLLEQIEYFRARTATSYSQDRIAELVSGEPELVADWGRVAVERAATVETGHLFVSADLAADRKELEEVWRVEHDSAPPSALADILNVRPEDAVTATGVRVIGWGMWASFLQRHIVSHALRVDDFYRRMLGLPDEADEHRAQLDARLGALDLYPIARTWRQWDNNEYDCRGGVADGVRGAVRAPELVTARNWQHLDLCAQYEPGQARMPSGPRWFMAPTLRTPYEAGARLKDGVPSDRPADVDALLRVRGYDRDLMLFHLALAMPVIKDASQKEVFLQHAFGSRVDYDVNARRIMESYLTGEAWAVSRRRSCELVTEACFELATWLRKQPGREEEAASAYERILADETVNQVWLSNETGWIVDYYVRQGNVSGARSVALRSAGTGSAQGLLTLARFYEGTMRWAEAEATYRRAAERYEQPGYLIPFYYRMARVRHRPEYEPRLAASTVEVFPNGLQTLDAAGVTSAPGKGVYVYSENAASRRADVRPSDIIVALDGWRVETVKQYDVVRAFVDQGEIDLLIWRDGAIHRKATVPDRRFGINLRDYPFTEGLRR